MDKARILDRLRHMLEAIDSIYDFTRGKSFEDYTADRLLRAGVERYVERLSEASRHVPAELKNQRSEIPWRQVADIGNILRHFYQAWTMKSFGRSSRRTSRHSEMRSCS